MVYHHDEHRSAIDSDPPNALPRPLAQHHLNGPVRPQHRPVPALHCYICATVPDASRVVRKSAAPRPPELVRRDFPRGARDSDQHDRARMRTSMGSRDGRSSLGVVVGGQRFGGSDVLPPHLGDVSAMPPRD